MKTEKQILESRQVRYFTSAVPALAGAPYQPTLRETYDGRELKPFAGRPGAMDAFSLPSRTGFKS